jgi:hypothetical protein
MQTGIHDRQEILMIPTLARPGRLMHEPRLSRRPQPGRWVAALLLAALIPLSLLWWRNAHKPDTLAALRLAGARGPVCERFVLGDDVSGSMRDYASARESALSTFLAWAPRNLRADDQLGVLDFAEDAGWARTPVAVGDSAAVGPATGVQDGRDTLMQPVLDLVRQLPSSTCDTSLLLFSDAQLADLPMSSAAGRELLRAAGIHNLVLLVPGKSISVPGQWTVAYPVAPPQRFDGRNSEGTAVAVAKVVARLTDQQLVRR